MLDFVLNFLFPPVCGICGKINENWLCNKCKKRIKKYERFELIKEKHEINNLFKFTNNYIKFNENLVKYDIKNKSCEKIYFDEFLYCFEYKKIIRNLLLKYKFSDCAYLSNMFGNVILNNKKINEILKKYDIIIPVPMDKFKKIKRGYNQTELITKYLEKNINFKIDIIKNIESKDYNNIIIDNKSLIKNKTTKTQSTLKAEERIKNIENSFEVKNIEKLRNKKVILFDDIATTGATVNEISRILKNIGVRKILVLVIAKD